MVIPDTVYRGEREVSYVARVDLDGSQALDLSNPEAAGGSSGGAVFGVCEHDGAGAEVEGFAAVADGTNADDLGDLEPGA